jgi:hypothetical protein
MLRESREREISFFHDSVSLSLEAAKTFLLIGE